MEIIKLHPDKNDLKTEKLPFEELYEKNWSSVYFYLLKKTGNKEDAEDLANDAFLYCYDHYDDYDPSKSNLSTWLYLVVNSRLKNYYRDKRESTDISELENYLFADEVDMGRAVYLEQLRKGLTAALQTLPEKQQEAVIRRYFREESYESIAEYLGTTPGNARVILSRALDRLKNTCKNFE